MKAEMILSVRFMFLSILDLVLLSSVRHTLTDNKPKHKVHKCIHAPSTGVSKQGVCYTN